MKASDFGPVRTLPVKPGFRPTCRWVETIPGRLVRFDVLQALVAACRNAPCLHVSRDLSGALRFAYATGDVRLHARAAAPHVESAARFADRDARIPRRLPRRKQEPLGYVREEIAAA
jgi:hypothetical protein